MQLVAGTAIDSSARADSEVNTSVPLTRTVLGCLFAISAGLGLGLACSPAGGEVVDPTALPFDEPRTGRTSTVSAATWTDGPWPFTIERGELTCIGPANDPRVFVVTDTGDMFALNPAAIYIAHGVGANADLGPIWRNHPYVVGAKVNVSPMIVYALALC